jgi:hypothetical protein
MESHKNIFLFPLILATLLSCVMAKVGSAADSGTPPAQPSNKLTLAYYGFSSDKTGIDANLRHTFKSSTAWIGGYREGTGFDQARVGYEYDYVREKVTFIPSAQAATRGFLGVSVYGEVGRSFFGIGGWGRTNLRPYWNLGFDPNDYVQLEPDIVTILAIEWRLTPFGMLAWGPVKPTRISICAVICHTTGG